MLRITENVSVEGESLRAAPRAALTDHAHAQGAQRGCSARQRFLVWSNTGRSYTGEVGLNREHPCADQHGSPDRSAREPESVKPWVGFSPPSLSTSISTFPLAPSSDSRLCSTSACRFADIQPQHNIVPILKNSKHELIAQRLAAGDSATKALIAAGYSKRSASSSTTRMFARFPEIRQRCEEILAARNAIEARRTAQLFDRKEIDRAYVRNGLQEIYERCAQAVPVVVKGVVTGEYQFDAANALRALEDMGKDLSMFIERKEIGPPGAFATPEERKAAEERLKVKMVKLGMARPLRIVGSSSAVPTSKQEIEAPDHTGEPEPESSTRSAAADPAPLPPGINELPGHGPDPAATERLKPAEPGQAG